MYSQFPLLELNVSSLNLRMQICVLHERLLFWYSLSVHSNFIITLFLLCRSVPTKNRIDGSENLTLDHIRSSLIRQEDSIIYCLLERAQYCYNEDTYDPDTFSIDGFHGSLVEYMVRETEKLHAKVWTYAWQTMI